MAALVSRFGEEEGSARELEALKYMKAVSRDVPGIIKELVYPRAYEKFRLREHGLPPHLRLINAGGPLLSAQMETFAAKIGFAMYHDAYDHPVPLSGGVIARWFSNLELFEGRDAAELRPFFSERSTLTQGKKSVASEFSYTTIAAPERDMVVVRGDFGSNMAVIAFAAARTDAFDSIAGFGPRLFRPGDFRV